MRRVTVFLGPVALLLGLSPSGLAQNQQYRPPPATVGRLRDIGIVGSSSILYQFGQVGGSSLALRSRPQQPQPFRPGAGLRQPARLAQVRTLRDQIVARSQGAPIAPSGFQFRTLGGHPLDTRSTRQSRATFQTRSERIRSQLPTRIRQSGPLRQFDMLSTVPRRVGPIQSMLSRRNLLQSTSPLGRLVQRQIPLESSEGSQRGRVTSAALAHEFQRPRGPDPDRMGESGYDDHLQSVLKRQEEAYYAKGVDYFSDGKLVQARDCFKICKTLDRENARYFAADAVVAFAHKDANRAVLDLYAAIRRAEALDELRIRIVNDRVTGERGFYGDDRGAFERVVGDVNVWANAARGTSGHAKVLLAYFAWLKGELRTAITATREAERELPEDFLPVVTKFRDFLLAQRAASTAGV